ncbi:MAG: hypothetical protein A2Y38_22305 [Spirochaetes bacterium GWB1_59_5]|nr:MAG: hypothetical protein A2Y38_22305 [Spirochaetes bacterium GWB1_59_5]
MPATFATEWLSRTSLVAAAVFAYCAWLVVSLDRESKTNRVAMVFNLVFALWAAAASFWYASPDSGTALFLYRAFAWTWCVFPPLILHFTLRVSGNSALAGRWGRFLLVCLYAPSIAFSFLVPLLVLVEPIMRGGYWMLAIQPNAAYFMFVIHYFSFILVSVFLAFRASSRALSKRGRKRFAILGWSYLVAVLLGFITDTLFLYAGLDFPNLAIFWILILSIGMIISMQRYGFLSLLPTREAITVLESIAEFIIYLDDSGRVIWSNHSAISALGCSSLGQARNLRATDFLPSGIAENLAGKISSAADFRGFKTSLGPQTIPVSLRVHLVRGDETEGIILTAIDLRPEFASARFERRLADAGLLLDEFMARSLDGIVLTDTEGRVVRWNEPMVTMTGIGADEALGVPYWELRASVEPEGGRDVESLRTMILSVLAGREPPRARRVQEKEICRRDGAKRFIQSDWFAIPMVEGILLATIARDVTEERRQAEENIERIRNLDHAQKMEAVGTLSGGIAHDFNNTLAGIMGAASLLRHSIDTGIIGEPGEMSRELEIIERSAQRAASSVKRLLMLTRKRSPESVVFRLDDILRRVCRFAERSVDQSVHLEIPDALPEASVSGDSGQVEQLILNLVINAEHAMTTMRQEGQKRGGTITLGVRKLRPEKSFLDANPDIVDRGYWALTVADEGVGIPRHIQGRIFDPFYTTKPTDKSSGLGLAMVHAIARQHGGYVDLRSELGAGAEFTVCLPCTSEVAVAKLGVTKAHHGEGLVLIADDDELPRETAVIILEALGYRTVATSGGEEALRLFEERAGEWKLVVLDLLMVDLPGDEVAARMRALRPDLPVVLVSGLHSERSASPNAIDPAFSLLPKPYTITELGQAIDAAMCCS